MDEAVLSARLRAGHLLSSEELNMLRAAATATAGHDNLDAGHVPVAYDHGGDAAGANDDSGEVPHENREEEEEQEELGGAISTVVECVHAVYVCARAELVGVAAGDGAREERSI